MFCGNDSLDGTVSALRPVKPGNGFVTLAEGIRTLRRRHKPIHSTGGPTHPRSETKHKYRTTGDYKRRAVLGKGPGVAKERCNARPQGFYLPPPREWT